MSEVLIRTKPAPVADMNDPVARVVSDWSRGEDPILAPYLTVHDLWEVSGMIAGGCGHYELPLEKAIWCLERHAPMRSDSQRQFVLVERGQSDSWHTGFVSYDDSPQARWHGWCARKVTKREARATWLRWHYEEVVASFADAATVTVPTPVLEFLVECAVRHRDASDPRLVFARMILEKEAGATEVGED